MFKKVNSKLFLRFKYFLNFGNDISVGALSAFIMVLRAVGRSENPGVPVVIRWA